ncbi:AAA family ATPase, partial [Brevibacillus porteri]
MKFKVLEVNSDVKAQEGGYVYLVSDGWNDWWKYRVMYQVYYKSDNDKEVEYIGTIKIGQIGMEEGQDKVKFPQTKFDSLPKTLFSLGQDKYYYENLNVLGDEFRDTILRSLNDIALDKDLFEKVKEEDVTSVALMRAISPVTFKQKLIPLANGNSFLTSYDFRYSFPKIPRGEHEYNLTFQSEPNSTPPTNVHAIIGRNGVGKTHMLWQMVSALLKLEDEKGEVGSFYDEYNYSRESIFDHIIYLSFSAFDEAKIIKSQKNKGKKLPSYTYIGLKKRHIKKKQQSGETISVDDDEVQTKSTKQLRAELINSMWKCKRISSKRARLEYALDMLDSDPVFSAANVSYLLKQTENESRLMERSRREERNLTKEEIEELRKEFVENAVPLCTKLSSGHSIVLLTISKLIEELEERTLVFLDEPECHLHPPLLSTFTRILSYLLIRRNGMGIIATHSPVVVQEIPSKCVWILNRIGREINLERPERETFGENINLITKNVFSFE